MFAVWFLYLHCASLLFGARAVDGPYRPTHKSITWQRGTPDVVFQDTCHVSESHCGLGLRRRAHERSPDLAHP